MALVLVIVVGVAIWNGQRPVSVKDLVGTYVLAGRESGGRETLTLRSDGTFTKTYEAPGGPELSCKGVWTLEPVHRNRIDMNSQGGWCSPLGEIRDFDPTMPINDNLSTERQLFDGVDLEVYDGVWFTRVHK